MIETISFIGSGNVATHLAKAFHSQNVGVVEVVSQRIENASALAEQVGAVPVRSINALNEVDLVILAVPDDAISMVLRELGNYQGLVAHTSGITGLENERNRLGYLYPLQSFRKGQYTNFLETPIYVNAKGEGDRNSLVQLAGQISEKVKVLANEEKQKQHLSAVFVNNYVNHLFGLSNEYLQKSQLDFSDLQPIIQTTIERALHQNPYEVQTGPAIRRDEKTLRMHMKMLDDFPEMQRVYDFLAESIQRKHRQ